jgi:hypothetical protein
MQEPSLRTTVNTLKGLGLIPSLEENRAQLEKILASQTFQGAEVLKAFLAFVVRKSLEGMEGEVKEYTIATEVFGRSDKYDPRIDSLVRVQAARLRSKLEDYYATEGKNDQVYIDLPKGHYVATFAYLRPGEQGQDSWIPEAGRGVPHYAMPIGQGKRAGLGRAWVWMLLSALLVVSCLLGALAFRYYLEAKRLRESAASQRADSRFVQEIAPLWGEFLSSATPILVSYSNPIFRGNLVGGLRYWVPLQSSEPKLRPPSLSEAVGPSDLVDTYTGVGEAKGINFLGNLLWKAGISFRVERSWLLTYEDLKAQNIIFLGGPSENLLLRRLPEEQDFVFHVEGGTRGSPKVVILNRRPAVHEQRSYAAAVEGPSQSMVTEDYAIISMLRGLEPNYRLLILAGITTFGTQACAEYVTMPDSMKELIGHLNTSGDAARPKLPACYQVLLKVKINGSVPVQTSYVTHHVLN